MTAEVAVLNSIGVALAADSAVAIGPRADKIHISADKLFLLSDIAPIGIMVFGNANINGIPWETVIKDYRCSHRSDTYSTLEECEKSFNSFLKNNRVLFSIDIQKRFVSDLAGSFFVYLRKKYKRGLEKAKKNEEKLTVTYIKKMLSKIINEERENAQKSDILIKLPKDFKERFFNEYGNVIKKTREEILGDLPRYKNDNDYLIEIIFNVIIRKNVEELESGVVLAGFGEKEYFPSIIHFKIKGVILNHPIKYGYLKKSVGQDTDALIFPFAQPDMVYTFMNGIHPILHNMIIESTGELYTGLFNIIIREIEKRDVKYSKILKEKLDKNIEELINKLFKNWEHAIRKIYINPVMQIVASLTKEQLAGIAESLVNLTKFKREMSSTEKETVAGPIDVAVITKGDGFIWVKRKHYFEIKDNPRFLAKYLIGGTIDDKI